MIAKLAHPREFVDELTEKEINSSKVVAIKLIRKTGAVLSKEIPEIATDYRSGMRSAEIAERYKVANKFGLTLDIAIRAVYYALRILLTE